MFVRRTIRTLLLALAALCIGAAPALAAPFVSAEFDVPGLGSNNKLAQGSDGNMWVTLDGVGRDVARITPAGEVKEFNLEAITPSGIAVGPGGRLWITRNGGVTSFDPISPETTKDPTEIALIGTEHSIVLGPDGNLWVATTDKLVKVPPAAPATATEVPLAGLRPKDIDVAGGLLVVASLEHIYAVNTAGVVVGDQKVSGQAQGVAGGPSSQYAFTQPVNSPKEIGLLSPVAAPWILPAEGTDPFGIALGADGAYWSPEFITDGLMRLTTTGQLSFLPGFVKESGPRQIAAGPGNTLWVTLETTDKVGRVSGVEAEPPPLPPPPLPIAKVRPRTRITGGPKGRVTTRGKVKRLRFRFRSPDAGARFQCRLKQVPRKKARKGFRSPKFRGCKSPRVYLLKPGRYRFEVRALINGGLRDRTPAKRNFRVVRIPKR